MKEPLKIGVMGCASIAERMVIPAIVASENFTLVAVASRTQDRALAYAEKFGCEAVTGYENLISRPDIDAVYIPLPTGLHHEWALKAIEQNKHVLIEKSLATNLHEAEEIVQRAREKKLLVKENFMFEYHRQFALIRSILSSGRLGTIRCIRSSFGFPPFPDAGNIRYQKKLGGGALLDAGAYTLKVASLLGSSPPAVIGAHLYIDTEKQVDIHGGILMNFNDGSIAETTFGFDHFYQCNLELWGTKGKLTAGRIFTAGPGVSPKIWIETTEGNETIEVEPDNHFIHLLDDFADLVRSRNFEGSYDAVLLQARLIQNVNDKAAFTHGGN